MKVNPKTRIGHIHLTVANLDRSLKFYRDILGFEVTQKYGDSAVFLSAGGYHHHIGLNTWQGEGVKPQPQGYAGLFHFAILYPSRKELAKTLQSLIDHKYPIEGATDHGVSEALYLNDPDNIGVELYADRAKKLWPTSQEGRLEMVSKTLDIQSLLKELES